MNSKERKRMRMKKTARVYLVEMCEKYGFVYPEFFSRKELTRMLKVVEEEDKEKLLACYEVFKKEFSRDKRLNDREIIIGIKKLVNAGRVREVTEYTRQCLGDASFDKINYFLEKHSLMEKVRKARKDSREWCLVDEENRVNFVFSSMNKAAKYLGLSERVARKRATEYKKVADGCVLVSYYDYYLASGMRYFK